MKGAFTGAYRDHKGRFELAHQGTLFLDDVGDIPLNIQVKLLRVIQEKQFEPVGGQDTIYSDFRLISATNKPLKNLVAEDLFREDLFYRLSVVNIDMPPLREHPEDIPLLIKYFLNTYSQTNKKEIKTISMEALKLMQAYSWPGNVRQLENAVESAIAMCEGNIIKTSDLPLELSDLSSEQKEEIQAIQGSLPEVVESIETQMIRNALDQNDWIKARSAKALGIHEKVLTYKMKKYGIERK